MIIKSSKYICILTLIYIICSFSLKSEVIYKQSCQGYSKRNVINAFSTTTAFSQENDITDLIEEEIIRANDYIDKGIVNKDYNKYYLADELLISVSKKASKCQSTSYKARVYLSITYSYLRMRNEYTNELFNTKNWDRPSKSKQEEDRSSLQNNDWNALQKSYDMLNKVIAEAAEISSQNNSTKGDIYFLVAICYELLRRDAPVGNELLSKDNLYEKAKRYLINAQKYGCGFQDIYNLNEYYQDRYDAWQKKTIINSLTTDKIFQIKIISENTKMGDGIEFIKRISFTGDLIEIDN